MPSTKPTALHRGVTKLRKLFLQKPSTPPAAQPPTPTKAMDSAIHVPIHDICASQPLFNPSTNRRSSPPTYHTHHEAVSNAQTAIQEAHDLRLRLNDRDKYAKILEDGFSAAMDTLREQNGQIGNLKRTADLVEELEQQLENAHDVMTNQQARIHGLEGAERVIQSLLNAQTVLKRRIMELEGEKLAQEDILQAVRARSWVPKWCFKAQIAELSLRLMSVQAALRRRDKQMHELRTELRRFRQAAPQSPQEMQA